MDARFAIWARVPAVRGIWSAPWLLASVDNYADLCWPDNGEIDIMEHVGYGRSIIHSTIHTDAYNHVEGTPRGESMEVPDTTSCFPLYA